MFAAIDTGTTNTRIYIINKNEIVGKAYKKIGVRDTAISGSKKLLKQGIRACFFEAVENAEVKLEQIDFAIASGMIITEIGLIDIPHLVAPAGLNELSENAVIVRDTDIFPVDIPVVFIPGIKNDFGQSGLAGIRNIDFMKGEETQVMGILAKFKPALPCNVFIFSSHTKLIHIDDSGRITGSITTLSGQIFEAIKEQTSIGKSINEENPDFFSDEIIDIANDCVQNAGFLRTLLMPRFMEVLLDTQGFERRFFIEAAIASDDLKILDEAKNIPGIQMNTDFIFIGHKSRCQIYEKLIAQKGQKGKITSIWDNEEIDDLVVQGDVQISKWLIDKGKI